jgi:hypothetical protein
MGIADIFWMALIIGGALYLLYRSIWKKKGCCSGCDSKMCEMKMKRDHTAKGS